VPVTTLAELLFARSLSGNEALRRAARTTFGGPPPEVRPPPLRLVEDVQSVLCTSKIVSYAQGLHVIDAANERWGGDVSLSEVARISRGGALQTIPLGTDSHGHSSVYRENDAGAERGVY